MLRILFDPYILRRMGLAWHALGSIMVIGGFPGIAGGMFLVGTICTALALDKE